MLRCAPVSTTDHLACQYNSTRVLDTKVIILPPTLIQGAVAYYTSMKDSKLRNCLAVYFIGVSLFAMSVWKFRFLLTYVTLRSRMIRVNVSRVADVCVHMMSRNLIILFYGTVRNYFYCPFRNP